MAKGRGGLAAPFVAAERSLRCVEAPERAQDQKHGRVSRGGVDGSGHIGNVDFARCAGRYVDLVVAGAWGGVSGCGRISGGRRDVWKGRPQRSTEKKDSLSMSRGQRGIAVLEIEPRPSVRRLPPAARPQTTRTTHHYGI